MPDAKRILVLAESATFAAPFHAVAEKLALEMLLGTADDRGRLRMDFDSRDPALQIVEFAQEYPIAGIVPIGDATAPVAARGASMLGLPFHAPKAADTCKSKGILLKRLEAVGIPVVGDNDSNDSALTIVSIMFERQLRVLAAFRANNAVPQPFSSLLPSDRKAVSDALRNCIRALILKHGPVVARFSNTDKGLALAGLSDSYSADEVSSALHFRIPLVDEEVSFAELVVRNALGLDTSRMFLNAG